MTKSVNFIAIGVRQALRNILRAPVRSILTVLSVAVSISLYALMTDIGASFHHQMLSIVKGGHVDVVVKSRFSATPLSSSVTLQQAEAISHDPTVEDTTSVVMGKIRTNKGAVIYMVGIRDFWQVAHKMNLTLTQGRPYHNKRPEAVISSRLLHVNHLQIGDTFPAANDINLTMVGAYSAWLSLMNNMIICSDTVLQKILGRPGKTNMLFLSLHDPLQSDTLIKKINKKYPNLRALPSRDLASQIGSLTSLAKMLDVIALIALGVAIIILMSTFVMATYMRMRQIGILGAIGWPKQMIVLLFMIESTFLSIGGGLVGLILSAGILIVLRTFFPNIAFYLPETLSPHVIVMSLLMSMGVGAVAAILPAYHAVQKPIVEALRDE